LLNEQSKPEPRSPQRFALLRDMRVRFTNSSEPYRRYWRIYGGLHDAVRSVYVWTAVLLTMVSSPYWMRVDEKEHTRAAVERALDMLPSLMALTLAGMAIVLALSGGAFLDAIRENGGDRSLFMKVVSLFFHFLVVQFIALSAAFISAAYPLNDWIASASFFFLAYSITSGVSIAAMLFNVSRIYNMTGSSDTL
jgi:hypothetical protein